MTETSKQGNSRLRLRTRKQLLEAANRLMKHTPSPTLEEVAEEALISRATVYRYFPSVEALLNEAGLDVAFPLAETLFAGASIDPAERLILADQAVDEMIEQNEQSLRHMLIHSLKLSLAASESGNGVRQNRRVPLIEAALDPVISDLSETATQRLTSVLALIIGTESMLVFKDVLGMDSDEASDAKRWAIRTLVAAALRDAQTKPQKTGRPDRAP
jgi:AcrR family transcriptional regulator